MNAPLPTSGDPGGRPPRADALPRPALWPPPTPGEAPHAFDGHREDDPAAVRRAPTGTPGRWLATALLCLAGILLALALVLSDTAWALAAAVVLGIGGVLAWQARLFTTLTVERDPQDERPG